MDGTSSAKRSLETAFHQRQIISVQVDPILDVKPCAEPLTIAAAFINGIDVAATGLASEAGAAEFVEKVEEFDSVQRREQLFEACVPSPDEARAHIAIATDI